MVDTPDPPFTTWRRLALIFGVWALVAVMSTQTLGFALTRTGRSFDWIPIFASNFSSCMLWAAFTPFLLALGRRFRIERGVWPMHLALHLAIGLAFTVLDVYSWKLEAPYIRPGMPAFTYCRSSSKSRGSSCSTLAGTSSSSRSRTPSTTRRCRARSRVRRAQLQSQLDAARLDALQSQLRPHFLFNTLTTIAEQVYGDPAGADTMITRLSSAAAIIVRRSRSAGSDAAPGARAAAELSRHRARAGSASA